MRHGRHRPFLLLAALLAAALLLPRGARAQGVTAGVRGRVTNQSGQGIADALVRAVDTRTGATRVVFTDRDGRYQVLLLPPGVYDVEAEVERYVAARRTGVELPVQAVVEIHFELQMAISEKVQVQAAPPAIDPSNTSLGLRVDQETIESLPLNGRRFTDLALLDSAARPSSPAVLYGEQASVLTLNGSGARSNAYLVDGSDNNDSVFGSRLNAGFSQQVIQEFHLLSDGYSAEFGRASGGVMNIITRSGTNDFGGSAFFTFTNQDLNGTSPLVEAGEAEAEQSALERRQFGFVLGGPFVKDRAFYLLSYEGARSTDVIGYTGIDRDLNVGGSYASPVEGDRLFLRTDFNLNPVHYLSVRFSWADEVVSGINVIGRFTPEFGSTVEERDGQVAASLRSIFNPNLFNEARFLISDSDSVQTSNSTRPGVFRPAGVFGGNDLVRRDIAERQYQFIDNVTAVRGDHTLKFGLDVSHLQLDMSSAWNPNGVFKYYSHVPYDETRPETYAYIFRLIQGGDPRADVQDTVLGAFVQDEWSVHPDLQLNLGLRYEMETFELDEKFAVPSSIPNGGASRDTDNLAPRISLTWRPTDSGKLLVRGGWGLFYDKVVLGFPSVAAITAGQTIQLGPFQNFEFPIDENYVEANGVPDGAVVPIPNLTLQFSTGDTLDTPYTSQWNVGIERAFKNAVVFGVNYVHARGYHIPLYRDLNPVLGLRSLNNPFLGLLDTCPVDHNCIPEHLDPFVGSIAAIETMGNTWYDALQFRLQRGSGKFQFLLSYTLSKAEDEGSDPLANGVTLPPDSYDIRGERARSDNDQRHRLVWSSTWYAPHGFQVSPLITYASGSPFNVTTGWDPAVDGFDQERPDGVSRNSGAGTSIAAINAARQDANDRLYRDLPEAHLSDYTGDLEEPDFLQVDLRVAKLFDLGESASLEAYLQIFNLLDRANEGLVDGAAISPTFGEPQAVVGPPRIIELGIRYGF